MDETLEQKTQNQSNPSIDRIFDPRFYLESFCKIKGKEAVGLIPFILTPAQLDFFNALRKYTRVIALKSRQIGFSTAVAGFLYHKTITNQGVNTALVAHKADVAAEFLDKIKTFWRTTPEEVRPRLHFNSKYEMSFPSLDSKIMVLTGENVGRGMTLHNVLASELALWDKPEEMMLALENAVPLSGQLIVESCVTGDTYVLTSTGWQQMKDVVDWRSMPMGSGIGPDITLDTHMGAVKTNQYYRSGVQKGYRVKTQTGATIGMSSIHPLLLNRDGQLGMVKAKDMVVGDYIAVKKGQNMWGDYDPCSDFRPTPYKKNGGYIFNPKEMTTDLAYLIGMIVGDGHVRWNEKGGCVCITAADDETREFLLHNMMGLHFYEDKICGNPTIATHVQCTNKSLVEFLIHCGIQIGVKAPKKTVPSAILRMRGEHVAAFLSGLFDTDGGASSRDDESKEVRVSLSSPSIELLNVVRLLLVNFGIISYINDGRVVLPTERVKAHSFIYTLDVAGSSLSTFFSRVGFRLTRKQRYSQAVPPSRGFLIPGLRKWCKERYSYYGWGVRGISGALKLGMGERRGRDMGIRYPRLNRGVALIPDALGHKDLQYLKKIHDADYFYDQIVSVEPIEEEVFDFTVPGAHTFNANGFMSSNTPNGAGNLFHRMWMNKDNGYEKRAYGWWWHYSEEEIAKIRAGRDPRKFAQEYSLEFLASGRNVFDLETVNQVGAKYISRVGEAYEVNGKTKFVREQDGLRIYRDPNPGDTYVTGVDVAEGVSGGDFSAASIWNRTTGEEVAFWRGHIAPDKFAEKLNTWGRLYNNALMVVEVNNHGLTTLTVLKNLLYPQLYFRPAKFDVISTGWSERLGWKTTKITRPLLIDDLNQAIRDGVMFPRSEEFYEETVTFIYDDGNNMTPQSGYHDDCIFAAAIAYQGFKVMYGGSLDQVDYVSHLPSVGY